MNSHMVIIGTRLRSLIESLLTDVAADADHAGDVWVTRTSQLPTVRFRKRRASRGREDDLMRLGEGITVVPIDSQRAFGTNERDGVGYRFLVALASGTVTDEIFDDWPLPIWEQAIRQRLQNKRLGSLSLDGCELRTVVEPGKLPDWAMLEDGVDATFLVVTEYIRENRRS